MPACDPETDEPILEFSERFVEKRKESFPEWDPHKEFEYLFTVMVITDVPESSYADTVGVGDEVTVPAKHKAP